MSLSSSTMGSPTIPISYCRAIARAAGLQGSDARALLRGTGIEPEELLNDETMLTEAQTVQVASNAMRMTDQPALGLLLGHSLTPSTHGPLGFLASTSSNLGAAISAFSEYAPTRVSFVNISSCKQDSWLECQLAARINADECVYRMTIEALGLTLLSVIQFVLGRPLSEGRLSFTFARPAYADDYAKFFPCDIEFGACQNCLIIPAELLETPNIFADHENFQLALARCQTLLEQIPKQRMLMSDRVRKILLSAPPGHLSEVATAETLCISSRTMARRLAAEGTGYRRIKEEILMTLAQSYLRETTLPIETIANLLHYYDSASFRRAFKRLTKTTPAEFRSRASQNKQSY